MWRIDLDTEKCTGCGECAESCPGEVYEMIDGKAVPVRPEECHACHTCESVCAVQAITVQDE